MRRLLFVMSVFGVLAGSAFASVAVASPTSVVYDSIQNPLPPNVPSLGFQANQTAEFGDDVQLSIANPYVTAVTVTMSSWAKHSDWPGVGDANGFTHPITLNIYNVDTSGAHPALGSLITTMTQTASIPWRPETDAACGGDDAWQAADTQCYHGFAFNLTFNLPHTVHVPQRVILGIAYNTETWGANPINADGPYDSLNVGLNDVAGPTVGTDSESDAVFWNTMTANNYTDHGAGGTGTFRRDTAWSPDVPMFQVQALAGCTIDCYVDAATGDDNNTGTSPSSAKKTIGDALNSVSSGGTIHVAAGTYNVTKLHITKPVSILGAGASTTTIDGGTATLAASDYGTIFVDGVSGGGVTIKGFTLKNAGAPSDDPEPMLIVVAGNAADSPIDVENNHFIGVGGDSFDLGFWQYSGDGKVTLANNEFNGMWQGVLLERPRGGASVTGNNLHNLVTSFSDPTLYEPEGIFAFSYSGDNISALLDFSGNTFSGYNGDSVVVEGGYLNHDPAKFTNVKIDNNTISAVGAGSERRHVGIGLINYSGTGAQGGAPNAEIMGNTITGTSTSNDSIGVWLAGPSDGVQIKNNFINGVNAGVKSTDSLGDGYFTANAVVRENDLSGNGTAVKNGSNSATIDASANWWGSTNETNVSGATAGAVDFTPFLDSGTDTDNGTAGFQGNFHTLHVTALGSQVGTTGRIQEGVNDVSGSTVLVGPGSFSGNVSISTSGLDLQGAQADQDARTRSGAESIVTSMSVSASNVTVNGFSFNGTGVQIDVTAPSSTLSGVVLKNNIHSNYGDVAIPTYNAGDILIDKDLFQGSASSGEAIQIKADASTSGGCDGSEVSNSKFVDATNNGGADVNFSCTGSDSSNVTVSDNESTGNTGGSSFTAFSGVDDGIVVSGNTATTTGSSVFFFGNVSGTAQITGNTLTSDGSAVSIHGGDITSDVANTGDFTVTSNVLSGSTRGINVASGSLTGTLTAQRNDLSNESTAGLANTSAITADATCNWWGDANGPNTGSGSLTSGNMDVAPWLATSDLNGDCSVAQISLLPTSHSYGTIQTGTSTGDTTYTVKNVGADPLSITSVGLAGTNPGHFVIDTNNCDSAVLAENETCTILVYFHPTSNGAKSARLEVGSNDAVTPTAHSDLSGTGAPASQGTITINLDARPNGAQAFSFNGTNGIGLFSLTDNGTPSNTTSFSKDAGDYTITMTQVSGWALKSLTCDASETITAAQNKVTIHLASGQNVSCTFTDTKRVPDESIALSNAGPYAGVGIYSSTVQPSQTQNQAIKNGKTFNFHVHVKNSGLDSDTYSIFSTLNGSTAYKVKFFNGSTDITARVNAGTYRLTLASGAQNTIRIKVVCRASSSTAMRNIDLTMKSTTSTATDVVRAHVTRA